MTVIFPERARRQGHIFDLAAILAFKGALLWGKGSADRCLVNNRDSFLPAIPLLPRNALKRKDGSEVKNMSLLPSAFVVIDEVKKDGKLCTAPRYMGRTASRKVFPFIANTEKSIPFPHNNAQ